VSERVDLDSKRRVRREHTDVSATRRGAGSERDAHDDADGGDGGEQSPRSRRMVLIGLVALIVALTAALALAVFRYDVFDLDHSEDAGKIQGYWVKEGSAITLVISPDQLIFANGVAYDYTLDTLERTMEFHVGTVRGQARYEFGKNSEGQLVMSLTETLDGEQVTNRFVKVADWNAKDTHEDVFYLHQGYAPTPAPSSGGVSGGAAPGTPTSGGAGSLEQQDALLLQQALAENNATDDDSAAEPAASDDTAASGAASASE